MIDLSILGGYIVLIILGLCLCLGYVIKTSLDFIPNKYIPLIMFVLGMILNIWLSGGLITGEILLGGAFSGLASTGLHQAFKKLIEGK